MPGTGTTIAVSAGVSAIVTAIVGTLLNWGNRIVTLFRQRVPPDHLPIQSGGWATAVSSSDNDQIRVNTICAPNRHLRQKEIDPDKAIEFVTREFGAFMNSNPHFSSAIDGVQFKGLSGADYEYLWLWPSGRLDFSYYLPKRENAETDPVNLWVMDLLRPIATVGMSLKGDSYSSLFGRRLPGFQRRFDLKVFVSTGVLKDTTGSIPWSNVVFPGEQPQRAADAPRSFCPSDGFGRKGLMNWNPARPLRNLLRIFLEDFLKINGYHNFGAAVADALDTFEREVLPQLGEQHQSNGG